MDDLDRAILVHLQEDGRRPFTEIAKDLDVAEGTVRNRVSRLINEKVVQIVGLVDPSRVGFETPALVSIAVQPQALDTVAERIAAYPEVSYLLLVAGEYDLIAQVICRDREHLVTFITEQINRIPGVVDINTTFILRIHKAMQPDLRLILDK